MRVSPKKSSKTKLKKVSIKQNLNFLSKNTGNHNYAKDIETEPKSMVSKRIVSIKKTITRIFSNKKLILIPLFIILISLPLIYFALFRNTEKVVAWFDESFGYRQRVDITNAGTVQTNYQIAITLNTSTLISANKMQSDCDDIRLTDGNGKLLPIWIETGAKSCNTTTTAIWTKLSSIPTSGTTVYVYYGNPSVGSVQNGNNVFEFFDDFNASTIDSTKWTQGTISATSGTNFSQSGGNLVGGNTNRYIQSVNSYSGDYAAETRVYTTTAPANGFSTVGYYASSSNNFGILDHNGTSFYRNDSSWVKFAFNGTGQWSRNLVKVIGTNATYSRVGENSGSSTASTTNSGLSSEFLRLSARYDNGAYDQNYSATWDWIFIRKTASSEPSVGTPTNEEKSPAPVAYWKFDEGYGNTTQDSTANNNDGTITNAIWQSDDMCLSGKCLKFNGSSDYVTTYDYSLDYNSGSSFSLWFKPTSNNTGGKVKNILGKSNFEYILAQEDQKIRFIQWDPSGQDALNFTTGNFILPNNWYHLYFVYNSTEQKGYIYINGVNVAEQSTLRSSFINRSENLMIAYGYGWGGSTTPYFNGFIDDVKIYNYTRTADQIKADYNSRGSSSSGGTSAKLGTSTKNNPAFSYGLIGYWKMDETSGNAIDSSGNNYTGTPTGTTVTSGKYGNARSFNGSERITTTNAQQLSDFTISVWFKDDGVTTAYERLVDKSYTGGFWLGRNGSTASSWGGGILEGSAPYGIFGTFTDGQWNHMISIRRGTTHELYANGILVASNTVSSSLLDTTAIQIGNGTTNQGATSTIDEVRVYNRALSPAEVQALYNWAPGPILYYPFDEGVGQTVYDASGNNNDTILGYTSSEEMEDPKWVNGKFGKGLDFFYYDSDNISKNSSSVPTGADPWTASLWTKSTDLCTGRGCQSYMLYWGNMNNVISATYDQNGIDMNLLWNGNIITSTIMGKWDYITVTYDGATIKSYVNGTLYLSQESTLNIANSDIVFGNYFTGVLDDVKIYNYARTPAQIIEDMNGGHPAVGTPVGSAVAHYNLDEGYGTIANNVGNQGSTLNATIYNSTPWSQNGKSGKALSFDGTSNYYAQSNTNYLFNSDQTFSTWIYPTNITGLRGILATHNYASNSNFGLNICNTGKVGISIGYTDESREYCSMLSTATLSANQWYHLVLTYSLSSNTVKLYINGVLDSSWTLTKTAKFTTGRILIGQWSNDLIGGYFFSGLIDQVKVYNLALDSGQILTEYNSAKTLVFGSLGTDTSGNPSNSASREYCPPGNFEGNCATGQNPAPIGEWKFDDPNVSSGQSAVDTSGNNNHGQLGSSSGVDSSDPTWVNGKVGKALKFDGSNDYVIGTSNLGISGNAAFSMCAWIKWGGSSWSTDYPSFMGNNSTGSANTGLSFTIRQGRPAIDFWNNRWRASEPLLVNTWYHICGTKEAGQISTTSKIFVNGILVSGAVEGSNSTPNITNSPPVVGRLDATRYFQGVIDSPTFYPYARTPSQIVWDYNRGKPVAHYKLDECQGTTVYSTNETYNSALNGTWYGSGGGTQTSAGTCSTSGTAWYDGRSGKLNSSLNFDGNDDEVLMTENSLENIVSNSSAITLSAWIKASSFPSTGLRERIINGWISDGSTGFELGVYGNLVEVGGRSTSGDSFQSTTTTETFNTGTWYHLVGILDYANDQLKIFIDGKLVKSSSVSFANSAFTKGTLTSSYKGGIGKAVGENPFHGLIDDVRIYNYALTPEQIKLVMNDNSAINFK